MACTMHGLNTGMRCENITMETGWKKSCKGDGNGSGVFVGEKELVFTEIEKIAGEGDYRQFAKYVDDAMKSWNILEQDAGYWKENWCRIRKKLYLIRRNQNFRSKLRFAVISAESRMQK